MSKRLKFIALVTFFLFSIRQPAYANVPIGAAFVMAFPLLAIISSWGWALAAAVLIEGLILRRRLGLKYIEAFRASFLANLFSTLIGIGIGIAYSSSFAFLICWIPGTIILKRCFVSLAKSTGRFQNLAKRRILCFITFLGVGFIGVLLGGLLLHWKSSAPNFFMIIPISAILLILGFMITVITEGFIVARRFPQKQNDIIPAVVLMNLFSYSVLLLVMGSKVWRTIFS